MSFVNVLKHVYLARGLREHGLRMLEEARLVAAPLLLAEVMSRLRRLFYECLLWINAAINAHVL